MKKLQKYYKSINWNEVKPRSESKDNKNFHQGKSFIPELKSLHYLEEFKDLFIWVNTCLNDVRFKVGWNEKYISNLSVSQSWLNFSRTGEWHHKHYHMFSILSGILYLSSPAYTQFFTKSIYALPPLISKDDDQCKNVKHHYSGSIGELIIFPSNLVHWVGPNMERKPRVTLSLNSWFEGEIGCQDSLTYINSTIK